MHKYSLAEKIGGKRLTEINNQDRLCSFGYQQVTGLEKIRLGQQHFNTVWEKITCLRGDAEKISRKDESVDVAMVGYYLLKP
jgi:hypothetical protein